jgi:putative oxygen-independent coproporphyrinogen III oxidase
MIPHPAPPLSVYVHLPWCLRKCPYCDFNSYEAKGGIPEGEYVDALLRDLDSELHLVQGRSLESVFIGGGTPSLFGAEAIARLLTGIRGRLPWAGAPEVTLEANPGAIEAGRFAGFRQAGVNRLSIGVQSLRDARLAVLGRVHGAGDAVRAVGHARRAGFDNFNLDLMYALPGDDAEGALYDLREALALEPPHLSWYQLTLEPNTAFHRRPPPLPDEDVVAEIERLGRALLAERGYVRYEVSAYARPGARCRHNLNYWQFGDYLGLGAGAHGKITQGTEGVILRRAKTRNPRTYLERAGREEAVHVERIESAGQIVVEFMMGALRLPEGVTVECFCERTRQSIALIQPALSEAARRGWMAADEGVLKPTPRGLELVNSVVRLF